MTRLIEVARAEDVPPGTARAIEVEGLQLALVNVGGTFFALDNECTHRAGPLGEGLARRGVVAAGSLARRRL
jgi:nitrite reductase (NADH) small subunit